MANNVANFEFRGARFSHSPGSLIVARVESLDYINYIIGSLHTNDLRRCEALPFEAW